MTPITLDAEPACPAGDDIDRGPDRARPVPRLRAERRAVRGHPARDVGRPRRREPVGDAVLRLGLPARVVGRYGANAHDETLASSTPTRRPTAPRRRSRSSRSCTATRSSRATPTTRTTTLRGDTDADLTPVAPDATAIFFGASYHADYATILAAPADLPDVARRRRRPPRRRADAPGPWDVVDLRRLRCGDPTADALGGGVRRAARSREGWTLNVEREDVCPVVTLPDGVDLDDYLATLGKKERHEIRRKVRRAEAVGEVRLDDSTDPLGDLEAFIDLHQRRWGADGLFPPTAGRRRRAGSSSAGCSSWSAPTARSG